MLKYSFRAFLLIIAIQWAAPVLAQQNFSCPWGANAACLDYGDKVCSSFGKCVDDDAICFKSYTCDYRGFVCNSDLVELSDKCQELAGDYDSLVGKYNSVIVELREASEELESVRERESEIKQKYYDLQDCILAATSLEDIAYCNY